MQKSRLSPLQEEVLAAFFRREQRFFLTGGAALAGYHLGHRTTADLDLFIPAQRASAERAPLDTGDLNLEAAARQIGATIEKIQTFPDFRRRLVRRGDDRVMVDLVVDHAVQGYPDKRMVGDVRIDPPEEILANKLCTLLSRTEPRDLVDLFALERAGFRVEDGLALAARKDAGLTPASLAWILSQITIELDAEQPLPAGIPPAELKVFLEDLISRLSRLAYPTGGDGGTGA